MTPFLRIQTDGVLLAVQLVRGSTSRHKTILIHGLPVETILVCLSPNSEIE